ncbi:phosphatidate cytidylyltransferase [Flavobacterium branchiophilum]|uniref:Phosphatidate cytidylyltransferase n=1 Tax=Flavobacterium branchiophilum TaxID=55197 RepID=A0A543G1S9_9FLAO|nr:phosphatidate cytidylyltransferase [Flavobacterium branchiophilum]TQM40037.1 phosphatidate cytidylyltransferase [Flavobacterium branchiophilum]GEM56691.1 hypothetical protein FB1_29120 [Flavobacterium branchiophilum NBRC 15030 = ATCC 35035]
MSIYNFVLIYFLIGGFGIAMINRKSHLQEANGNRWKKYWVYLLLVLVQLFLIDKGWYLYFGGVVVLIGLYEIAIHIKQTKALLLSWGVLLVAGGFYITFFYQNNILYQQLLFVTVVIFDGFSQLFGQLFGKTKLFPVTSPNKTVEGLLGGILSVMVTYYFIINAFHLDLLQVFVLGVFILFFAVLGDYLASLFKRLHQVKDYSPIIPGHGGILDRFDSLILASFGGYIALKLDFSNPYVFICVVYGIIIAVIFTISEILFHFYTIKVEITRKITHFLSGIVCLSFPYTLHNHWIGLLLCISFVVILWVSEKYHYLQSIHAIDRFSFGCILFPIAVYGCFFVYCTIYNHKIYFYLPIIILAISDPLAALFGKKFPVGVYRLGAIKKTLMGSVVFFLSCWVLVWIAFAQSTFPIESKVFKSIAISVLATFTEAISGKGFDNLSIPLVVELSLVLM